MSKANYDAADFPGFTVSAIEFLEDLSVNNNKEWFEKNKSFFKNNVEFPAKVLVANLEEKLSATFGRTYTGKLFRIYQRPKVQQRQPHLTTHIYAYFSLRMIVKQVSFSLSITTHSSLVQVVWSSRSKRLINIVM